MGSSLLGLQGLCLPYKDYTGLLFHPVMLVSAFAESFLNREGPVLFASARLLTQ